jgi:hypothetical protein
MTVPLPVLEDGKGDFSVDVLVSVGVEVALVLRPPLRVVEGDPGFAAPGVGLECVAAASERTCSPLPPPLPEDATVEGPRVVPDVVAGVAWWLGKWPLPSKGPNLHALTSASIALAILAMLAFLTPVSLRLLSAFLPSLAMASAVHQYVLNASNISHLVAKSA